MQMMKGLCSMQKNEIWTAEEKGFLAMVCERLTQAGLIDTLKQLRESLAALEYQANALSLYPSILNSNRLGGTERNLETLVSALSERYREEDVFVLPTKAILGRSYEIGKINLFYMLKHVANTAQTAVDIFDGTDPLLFAVDRMLSIMTEDVLLDLLSDSVRKEAKPIAAAALAGIWEGRISADSIAFNTELRHMWMIRQASVPLFGTLLGTHEYLSLCQRANEVSLKYIHYSTVIPDEASALEEFLFGLNFEEICIVKAALEKSGKGCFNRNEVTTILGNNKMPFCCEPSGDPLELYRFFNHRRKQAVSRLHSRKRGPIRTFEENFMVFLLLGKERSLTGAESSISNGFN